MLYFLILSGTSLKIDKRKKTSLFIIDLIKFEEEQKQRKKKNSLRETIP